MYLRNSVRTSCRPWLMFSHIQWAGRWCEICLGSIQWSSDRLAIKPLLHISTTLNYIKYLKSPHILSSYSPSQTVYVLMCVFCLWPVRQVERYLTTVCLMSCCLSPRSLVWSDRHWKESTSSTRATWCTWTWRSAHTHVHTHKIICVRVAGM